MYVEFKVFFSGGVNYGNNIVYAKGLSPKETNLKNYCCPIKLLSHQ